MNRRQPDLAVGGTRERLLEAALELMRESGLSGAGINEIVRESGAPKGSVYYFFPGGKEQIVTEALSVHSQRTTEFIETAMSAKRTPESKVKALFEAYAERFERGAFRHSCPAGTICLDLGPDSQRLRDAVAASLDQYVQAIAGQLQIFGHLRALAFAGLILSAIEGAYVRGRAMRSGAPFREAGAWLANLAESQTTRPATRSVRRHASRKS
jgi:TetR/AcrR family transcriptional repressor of lmrAB and yxaGH operons